VRRNQSSFFWHVDVLSRVEYLRKVSYALEGNLFSVEPDEKKVVTVTVPLVFPALPAFVHQVPNFFSDSVF